MKSVRLDKPKKAEEIKFPCVMISRDDDLVVFFRSKIEGTIVYGKILNLIKGDSSKSWNPKYFSPYTGSITLSNEEE